MNLLFSPSYTAPFKHTFVGTIKFFLKHSIASYTHTSRTPAHLAQSFLDAKAGHYALGVKLVRGAYHLFESTAHAEHVGTIQASQRKFSSSLSISNEELPPVWSEKEETDRCYNACARVLLERVKEQLKDGRRRGA